MAATDAIVAITAIERRGSVGRTPKSSVAISRFTPTAPASPTTTPTSGGLQALLHHQPDHAGTSRAERHPYADLAAALRHHVRQSTP